MPPDQNAPQFLERSKDPPTDFWAEKVDDTPSGYSMKLDAERGDSSAQFNVGYMYSKGKGLPTNKKEGIYWYQRAVDQGNADAQCNLGVLYEEGHLVAMDIMEAAKLYRLAANQGNAAAQHNLGRMYGNGTGVPQNYSEAYVWLSLAASSGNELAVKNRDIAKEKLTSETLDTAQKRSAQLFEEIEARKAARE